MTFDPLSPAFREDPFGQYRRLLAEQPIHRGALDAWFVTRYDDVDRLLRHDGLGKEFTQSSFFDELEAVTLQPRFLARAPSDPDKAFLLCDPPFHTRQRGLLTKAFSPAAARGLEEATTKIITGLLDQLDAEPGSDVVPALADPLPLRLLAALFGIPDDLYDRYATLGRVSAGALDVTQDQSPAAVASRRADLRALQELFLDLLERRRAEPGDDLVSRLVVAEHDGDTLTDGEIVCSCIVLIVAAYGAVKCFVSNALLTFSRHVDQWELLRSDVGLSANAVEEVSRFEPPVHAVGREATQSIEIDGHHIAPGDTVMPLIAAANRDPRRFADPDRFDITRPNLRGQLGFGVGIHYCPGTVLSRPASRTLFEELATRYRRIHVLDEKLDYKDGFGLRGPEQLHVEFEPAATS